MQRQPDAAWPTSLLSAQGVSLSRSYVSIRQSVGKAPVRTPSCAIITRVHELSALATERSELVPAPASELFFAGAQLSLVTHGPLVDTTGNALKRRVIAPTTALVTGMTVVIGQVQVVGIVFGNSQSTVADVVVPANKVKGVGHVTAPRTAVACGALVVRPSRILSLSKASRRRRPSAGNHAQYSVALGAGSRPE